MLDQLEKVRHVGRVEPQLGPLQTELLVDELVQKRRQRVRDFLAKQVPMAGRLCLGRAAVKGRRLGLGRQGSGSHERDSVTDAVSEAVPDAVSDDVSVDVSDESRRQKGRSTLALFSAWRPN